jgi:hypothetical protein
MTESLLSYFPMVCCSVWYLTPVDPGLFICKMGSVTFPYKFIVQIIYDINYMCQKIIPFEAFSTNVILQYHITKRKFQGTEYVFLFLKLCNG